MSCFPQSLSCIVRRLYTVLVDQRKLSREQEKKCDATGNDTRPRAASPKLNMETGQSTKSGAENVLKYESTTLLQNTEIRNDVILSAQEVFVPFSDQQPPIVTFDEWTKEKLKKEEIRKAEQQQSNQQKMIIHTDSGDSSKIDSNTISVSKVAESIARLAPPNMISQEATARNYASKECGAKVLFSNEEAENKNAILNEKEADDYMRNPCQRAEHKWLIIELCETIQPTVLEIANFELFSSGPQNIGIWGSERYPSNEWIALGDFIVENNREIQRFLIAARSYVKFLRLELLSHYGHEHYCTLSLIRLLGISMVDEYEAEAEAAAVSDTSFSIPIKVETINNTTPEKMDAAVSSTNIAKEDVSLIPETIEQNESVNDLPFVDAVVNAVGSIGIGNIKGVLESTFLMKRTKVSLHNVARSNATVLELCTKCSLDVVNNYVLFCRAFFAFQYSFIGADNTNATRNKQVRIHSSLKNRTRAPEFFLASILPTSICDVESGSFGDVQNPTSNNLTEPDSISTISPTVNLPTTANAKLNGGFMIPGGVMSHKESIFMKLNKRISNLELNMSLSSEYLSELSRRYVLQNNEGRRQTELIIKQAEEAAVNAIKPSIHALKIQMDVLAANLKELTEVVKGLPQLTTPVHNTMVLKHPVSRNSDADASLTRSQAHIYDYFGMWTSGELVCIVVFMNVLTLLILLLVNYVCTVINRSSIGQMVDKQKFIQKNSDVRSTAEVYPEQQLMAEMPTVVCDVINISQEKCNAPLALSIESCSLTENGTKEENYPNRSQSMEAVDRPSSQLSACSEQNAWQKSIDRPLSQLSAHSEQNPLQKKAVNFSKKRRRPKKVSTQESDIYTGLEKSDRELSAANVINDNTKRRKMRSDDSDNPYRRLYGATPYSSSSEFIAQSVTGGPIPVPSIIFEIEEEPTRTWYYCRWTIYWILWMIAFTLTYFLIFRRYYCPLLMEF
ncbi:SUN domain-containing ossification factor [Dirofilaria immitis]